MRWLLLLLLIVDITLCVPRLREDKSLKRFFRNAQRFQGAESRRPSPIEGSSDQWTGLRDVIGAVMSCPGSTIPGLAISIVKDNQIVFAEGFGFRDAQGKVPVTNTTLFGIGSCTKAFTSTLVSMLVDQGVLDFDAPVTNYLSGWKLKDPAATNNICLRDMMSQYCYYRTGMSSNDYLWTGGANLTRQGLVNGLQYLTPSYEFRGMFYYNNLMWATAGYIAGVAKDSSWEQLVQQMIFEPLGMSSTTTDVMEAISSGQYAVPFGRNNASVSVPFPYEAVNYMCNLVGPAAEINSNVLDLANWLQFHLNGGLWQGKQLASSFNLGQTITPQMVCDTELYLPLPTYPAALYSQEYGLGWWLGNYRGHPIAHHGGEVFGESSMMTFFPLDNVGIAITSNMDDVTDAFYPIALYVFDLLMGYPIWINSSNACSIQYAEDAKVQKSSADSKKEAVHAPQHSRKANTVPQPPPPVGDFIGTYEHPLYGQLAVGMHGSSLNFTWGNFYGPLIWQRNGTFTSALVAESLFADIFISTSYSSGDIVPENFPFQFVRNMTTGDVSAAQVAIPDAVPGPVTFVTASYTPVDCAYPEFVAPAFCATC